MFYWNQRGTYIVLTDAEEKELVRELADSPVDVIGYDTSAETRRKYEKRMFQFFRDLSEHDPETFRRRFVFRSCYGDEARVIFPALLDAYGRATRRATFGNWGGDPLLDDAVENVIHSQVEEVYHISLLSWAWWKPWKFRVTGRISFPSDSIEKIAGEVCNFTLMTEGFSIRLGRDFVRMSVRGCRA